MLELRRNEFAGLFGGIVTADPRVSVLLELFKCCRHSSTVSLPHAVVATH